VTQGGGLRRWTSRRKLGGGKGVGRSKNKGLGVSKRKPVEKEGTGKTAGVLADKGVSKIGKITAGPDHGAQIQTRGGPAAKEERASETPPPPQNGKKKRRSADPNECVRVVNAWGRG